MRNEIHFPNVWIGSRNRYEEIWLDNSTLYGGVNYIQQIADEGDDFQFGVVASAECRFVTESLEVIQYVKRGDRFEYNVQFDNNPMTDNFIRKGIFYVDSIKVQGKLAEVIGYDCVSTEYRVEVINGVKTVYTANLNTFKPPSSFFQYRNTIWDKLITLSTILNFESGLTIDANIAKFTAERLYVKGRKIHNSDDMPSTAQTLKEIGEVLGVCWVADAFNAGVIKAASLYLDDVLYFFPKHDRKSLIYSGGFVEEVNNVNIEYDTNNYYINVAPTQQNTYWVHAPHLLCETNLNDMVDILDSIEVAAQSMSGYYIGKIELFEEKAHHSIVQEGLHDTYYHIGSIIHITDINDELSIVNMVITKIEINNAGVTYYSYGNEGKRKAPDNKSTTYAATANKKLSNDSAGVNMNGSDISKCGAIQFTADSYGYTLPSTGVEGQIFFKLI